jgi:plastocyanin
MRTKLGVAALGCMVAAAIAMPAAAAARTKIVWAGGPPNFQNKLQHAYGAGANDYFPHTVTVNAGDSVSWRGMSINFHSIDIPKRGGRDLPLIVPNGTIASGFNDANGNPFWFNGQRPNVGINHALFAPIGAGSYNGSSRVDSGLPLGPPAAFTVKFTKPGVYAYFCNVHYDMRGIIVVLAKGHKVPSKAQDAATVAAQTKRDLKVAKALHKSKPHGNHVSLGEAGKYDVEILAMFPSTLHVTKGTTVTFAMPALTGETHTATFGPAAVLNQLANAFLPNPPAPAVYPSSPPPGSVPVPGPHGNGFANTGVLDQDPSTPQPASSKITFTTPGIYHYQCLIHPFMVGTVVVTS